MEETAPPPMHLVVLGSASSSSSFPRPPDHYTALPIVVSSYLPDTITVVSSSSSIPFHLLPEPQVRTQLLLHVLNYSASATTPSSFLHALFSRYSQPPIVLIDHLGLSQTSLTSITNIERVLSVKFPKNTLILAVSFPEPQVPSFNTLIQRPADVICPPSSVHRLAGFEHLKGSPVDNLITELISSFAPPPSALPAFLAPEHHPIIKRLLLSVIVAASINPSVSWVYASHPPLESHIKTQYPQLSIRANELCSQAPR